eukprot:296303-Pyramimonas_sp.AAC.1
MPPRGSQSERPREVEGYMRGQEEVRPKATTAGMLRTRDCSGMGWWGCAKREEFTRWKTGKCEFTFWGTHGTHSKSVSGVDKSTSH